MSELDDLLRKAKDYVDSLTPEQRDEMVRMQIQGVARAEASWPKAKYKWVNGVKVYESYEDYCND